MEVSFQKSYCFLKIFTFIVEVGMLEHQNHQRPSITSPTATWSVESEHTCGPFPTIYYFTFPAPKDGINSYT